MNIDLTGRKAVVTGSTAGIGRAIAEGLGRAGAAVVINGRTEKRVSTALRELRELLPKTKFTGVIADLATPEGAAELFAQAPDADILVNNVGTGRPKSFFEIEDSEWIDLFELNVMSGIRASRHYVPNMTKRGWGRVVFISSESALAIPKDMIDYATTKTAQLAIARGLAEVVGGTGVTVNSVPIQFANDNGDRQSWRGLPNASDCSLSLDAFGASQCFFANPRTRESGGGTLKQQLAFELGDHRQHRRGHLSGRAREVCSAQREAMNVDAHCRPFVDGRTHINRVEAVPVKFRDDQHIASFQSLE
jgi:NAD(P)-dependent dehydrogenase (short-subunit alcohol dehydrogenase family)